MSRQEGRGRPALLALLFVARREWNSTTLVVRRSLTIRLELNVIRSFLSTVKTSSKLGFCNMAHTLGYGYNPIVIPYN